LLDSLECPEAEAAVLGEERGVRLAGFEPREESLLFTDEQSMTVCTGHRKTNWWY
jgi:hypothetical protein